MRRHLSYANIAATLALVFAMSGGALAASHYLIESTKQISPKVLKKLHGAKGHTGTRGAAGAAGPQGAAGKEGAPGKEGPRGPSAGLQAFVDTVPGTITEHRDIGSLAVPAGNYMVTAKLGVENLSTTARTLVICSLGNDETSDSDRELITLAKNVEGELPVVSAMSLESTAAMSAAGHWTVNCTAGQPVEAEDLKIQAIQVASRSNTPG